MGWFEGLLGGFQSRHYDIEAEAIRQAENRNRREAAIFDRLLTSPDEEIRDLAAAGLFQSASGPKRKGGFKGWLGEMEQNPWLPKIQELARQGKTTYTPTLSTTQSQGYIGQPPSVAASAALPASNPTEIGSAKVTTPEPWPNPAPWTGGLGQTELQPPSSLRESGPDITPMEPEPQPAAAAEPFTGPQLPPELATPPPEPTALVGGTAEAPSVSFTHPDVTVAGTPGTAEPLPIAEPPPTPSVISSQASPGIGGTTRRERRQLFQTPEGQLRLNRIAQSQGDVEGDLAGLIAAGVPEAEARELIKNEWKYKALARGGAANYQSKTGQYTDENGIVHKVSGIFDPRLGRYIDATTREPLPANFIVTSVSPMDFGDELEAAAALENFGSAAEARAAGPEAFKRVSDRATKIRIDRAASQAGATATAKAEAEAKAPFSREKKFEGETRLAKDWLDISANSRETGLAVTKMETAMAALKRDPKNIGPATEAIILAWQRSNDPNSVVREAEARRPAEFIGLRERIYGAWLQLQQGGAVMSPELLQRYVALAGEIKRAMDVGLEGHRERILNTAMEYQFNPSNILPGYKPPAAPRTTTAAPTAAPDTAAPQTGVTLDSPVPGNWVIDDSGNWVQR